MYTTYENLKAVACFSLSIILSIYNIRSLFPEKGFHARFIQNTPLMECFFKKKYLCHILHNYDQKMHEFFDEILEIQILNSKVFN